MADSLMMKKDDEKLRLPNDFDYSNAVPADALFLAPPFGKEDLSVYADPLMNPDYTQMQPLEFEGDGNEFDPLPKASWESFKEGIFALDEGLRMIPLKIASSWAEQIAMDDIRDSPMLDWLIEYSDKKTQAFLQKYDDDRPFIPGTGITIRDAAQTPVSLGTSASIQIASILAGFGGSALGGPVGGVLTYGGTSAGLAYRQGRAEFTKLMWNVLEKEYEASGKRLTHPLREWARVFYENESKRYGLAEAIPETISNVLTLGILKLGSAPVKAAIQRPMRQVMLESMAKMGGYLKDPMNKAFYKEGLMKLMGITGKTLSVMGVEQATETITGKLQSHQLAKAELVDRESTWAEAFREQYGVSMLMGPLQAAMGAGANKIIDIGRQKKLNKIFTAKKEERSQILDEQAKEMQKEVNENKSLSPEEKKKAIDGINEGITNLKEDLETRTPEELKQMQELEERALFEEGVADEIDVDMSQTNINKVLQEDESQSFKTKELTLKKHKLENMEVNYTAQTIDSPQELVSVNRNDTMRFPQAIGKQEVVVTADRDIMRLLRFSRQAISMKERITGRGPDSRKYIDTDMKARKVAEQVGIQDYEKFYKDVRLLAKREREWSKSGRRLFIDLTKAQEYSQGLPQTRAQAISQVKARRDAHELLVSDETISKRVNKMFDVFEFEPDAVRIEGKKVVMRDGSRKSIESILLEKDLDIRLKKLAELPKDAELSDRPDMKEWSKEAKARKKVKHPISKVDKGVKSSLDEMGVESDVPVGAYSKTPKVGMRSKLKRVLKNENPGDILLKNIFERGADVHPKVKDMFKRFENDLGNFTNEVLNPVRDFAKEVNSKMNNQKNKNDLFILKRALQNSDEARATHLLKKFGLEDSYAKSRKAFDKLRDAALELGVDIGFVEFFWPRVVKDVAGLKSAVRGTKTWSLVEEALQKFAEKNGNVAATEDEQTQVIDQVLRGYYTGKLNPSKPGTLKQRVVDIVDGDLDQYYHDPLEAAQMHVRSLAEYVQMRKMLGVKPSKGTHLDLDNAVASYVHDLIQKGEYDYQLESDLKKVLSARFKVRSGGWWLKTYKSAIYLDLLGNWVSTMVQLFDLVPTMVLHGPMRTGKNFIKGAVNKTPLKFSDIGIVDFSPEFSARNIDSVTDFVLKWAGLNKMMDTTKTAIVNTVFESLQNKARKNDKKLIAKIDRIFGDEAAQTIQDLKDGVLSGNTNLMTFYEVSDITPVTLSNMPEAYIQGGNARIFYVLKSYAINNINAINSQAYREMREGMKGYNPKNWDKVKVLTGATNLAKMISALIASGATMQIVVDLLFGREIEDIPDYMVSGLLGAFGVPAFIFEDAERQGLWSATAKLIIPPFRFVDSAYKDLLDVADAELEPGEARVWDSMPWVGRFYSEWFGAKAKRKNKKRRKKDNISGLRSSLLKGLDIDPRLMNLS